MSKLYTTKVIKLIYGVAFLGLDASKFRDSMLEFSLF